LPQCEIDVDNYRQQSVPMSGLQNLIFKMNFLKVPITQKVKMFDLLLFSFQSSKFIEIFVTIITVAFFVHWTCSSKNIQWCSWI